MAPIAVNNTLLHGSTIASSPTLHKLEDACACLPSITSHPKDIVAGPALSTVYVWWHWQERQQQNCSETNISCGFGGLSITTRTSWKEDCSSPSTIKNVTSLAWLFHVVVSRENRKTQQETQKNATSRSVCLRRNSTKQFFNKAVFGSMGNRIMYLHFSLQRMFYLKLVTGSI